MKESLSKWIQDPFTLYGMGMLGNKLNPGQGAMEGLTMANMFARTNQDKVEAAERANYNKMLGEHYTALTETKRQELQGKEAERVATAQQGYQLLQALYPGKQWQLGQDGMPEPIRVANTAPVEQPHSYSDMGADVTPDIGINAKDYLNVAPNKAQPDYDPRIAESLGLTPQMMDAVGVVMKGNPKAGTQMIMKAFEKQLKGDTEIKGSGDYNNWLLERAAGSTKQGYTEWHRENSKSSASNINNTVAYGAPVEVTDPVTGQPRMIAPPKDPTKPVIELPYGPKTPEAQKKQGIGVENLRNAITEYRNELGSWNATDIVKPDARAKMGLKYNNMMLQAKEAYNLGVLNGPDFQILTSTITDPRSLTGAITSKDAMDTQASELSRIMEQIGKVSGQSVTRKESAPVQKPSMPKIGERKNGYYYKGGDPSSPSSWAKVKP